MPDQKVSVLPLAGPLTGAELIPGVQGGANVEMTASQVKTLVQASLGAYADVGGPGFYFPSIPGILYGLLVGTAVATATKRAVVGKILIDGKATNKVISSAGGKLSLLFSGTPTLVNAGSTLIVGLQDVNTTTGPSGRPDGTFDVSRTITTTTGAFTFASGWNDIPMLSGTKTLSNGDLVALVVDATWGGADAASLVTYQGQDNNFWPQANTYATGAWGTNSGIPFVCAITFDDGTRGVFQAAPPVSSMTYVGFSSATNPKENGSVVQVPWNSKVSGYKINGLYTTDANSDFKVSLYSDPFGTPALVAGSQVTVLAETAGRAALYGNYTIPLPAEITITKNTDYAIVVEAIGTGTVRWLPATFADANWKRLVLAGGNNFKKVYRNGSGAFTADPLSFMQAALEISQVFTV